MKSISFRYTLVSSRKLKADALDPLLPISIKITFDADRLDFHTAVSRPGRSGSGGINIIPVDLYEAYSGKISKNPRHFT